MNVMIIRDMKSQLFLRPNMAASVADGVRAMEIMVNEGESMIRRFPNDFRLYNAGTFDPLTGKFDIKEDFEDLGSAADFVRAAPVSMFDKTAN